MPKLNTQELEVDGRQRDGDLDAIVTKKVVLANTPVSVFHGLGRVPQRVVILSSLGGYPKVAWAPDANGLPQRNKEQCVLQFSEAATVTLQIA